MIRASGRRAALLVLSGLLVTGAASAAAVTPGFTPDERAYYDFMRSHTAEQFRGMLQGPPDVIDGQVLDPKFQYHNEKYAGRGAPVPMASLLDTPEKRQATRDSVDRVWPPRTLATRPMARVEDRNIAGPTGAIPVRIYHPRRTGADTRQPLPVVVYYHGGGWFLGSVQAVDPSVRLIANEAQAIVVSVEYRLAPEAQFPAAHDDAMAAFRWVRDHAAELGGDPLRVAVGGDSAGAQMSIVTALRALRNAEPGPSAMLLYYPVADMATEAYRSSQLFGHGFGLNNDAMEFFRATYVPNAADRVLPDASPMHATGLGWLPPALILTAGFDPLRDQGRVFAERMNQAGGRAVWRNYGSLIHGFLQHSYAIEAARDASIESAREFGRMLRGKF